MRFSRLLLLLPLLLATLASAEPVYTYEPPVPAEEAVETPPPAATEASAASESAPEVSTPGVSTPGATEDSTYSVGEMMTAAEGAFGEASEAVGKVVEKVFADLGRPNAYIVGREGSGALVVGLRYGEGMLYSKTEGAQQVYWTGPSVGFDVGGDASRIFTLVYNLYDTADLFHRYPAVEGRVYFVGGFTANYHQRKDVILVPIHLGVGWRLGANVGYLRYSKRPRVLPF